MSREMGVTFEGLAEINTAIATAIQMEAVKEAVKVHGAQVTTNAKRFCPVGTPETTKKPGYVGGTLRRSINIEISDGGLTATIEPHTEYAAYVELGTRFMKAQPYMRPALEQETPSFISDMRKIMGE